MWAAAAHSRGKLWCLWVKEGWVGVAENIIVQSIFRIRSMRMRVLGFIGFSCAAQCFLCVFYPIFNDNFGKWVLTRTFLCLLLLHFSSSGLLGVRDENAANYFNNVCKYFFLFVHWQFHHICIERENMHGLFMEWISNDDFTFGGEWDDRNLPDLFFNFNPFIASSCMSMLDDQEMETFKKL